LDAAGLGELGQRLKPADLDPAALEHDGGEAAMSDYKREEIEYHEYPRAHWVAHPIKSLGGNQDFTHALKGRTVALEPF
jgi:hypothetical protein